MKSSGLTLYWTEHMGKVDEMAGVVEVSLMGSSRILEEVAPGVMALKEKPVRGLSERFSKIETPRDICRFAAEYGLLGIANNESNASGVYPPPPNYGETYREPLSAWLEHAEIMRRLRRIYYILKRNQNDSFYDAEGQLLHIIKFKPKYNVTNHGTKSNDSFAWRVQEQPTLLLDIVWANDGRHTGVVLDEEVPPLESAAIVLASVAGRMLQGGIHLGYGRAVPVQDAPLGYRINERRYTYSPLAAAYYDLWEMVTEGRGVLTCGFCNRVIEKSNGRKYCNNAHKQSAYRLRKKKNKGRI